MRLGRYICIIRIAKVSGGVKGKRGKNLAPCLRRGKPGLCPGARKRFGYTSGMIAFIMEI